MTALTDRLRQLREKFLSGLPKRIELLRGETAWLHAEEDPRVREAIRIQAHQLAGSGTSFGCPELSAWGKRVERLANTASAVELSRTVDELAMLVGALQPVNAATA